MMTRFFLSAAVALASCSVPAFAQADGFQLLNGTDGPLGQLSIRRTGSKEWKPLSPAPSPGARSDIAFSDPDCAFDLQATIEGSGPVTWAGINLCDVKSVTLKRDSAAGPWVDYDAQ